MNQDQKRRDEIMGLEKRNYVGGLAVFEDINLEQLETLLKEDFVALTDVEKSAPTTGDFLNFIKTHPDFWVHGYVIAGGREDYRLRIKGLSFLGKVTEELKTDFATFSAKADDIRTEKDELYSWWS